MQPTVAGFEMWSAWQPDRNLFFNSYLIATDDGNIAIDPLPLDEVEAAALTERGGVAWVVVTNRDHERATADLVARFGAKVACGGDAPLLKAKVDRVLAGGERIGGALVVPLEGLKTPGEIALFFPKHRAVVVGDALWGSPAGSLRLMDDSKLGDPRAAALSLRRLAGLHPLHVLVGDGAPVLNNAFDVLTACLDARDDAPVNVINLDELTYLSDSADPEPYHSRFAEIGFLLGATNLGYRAAQLPPGSSFCPLHWHTREEELFIVWDGSPTLRTPRGTTRLRRGDLAAFPTNARGAHRVTNETTEPCTIVMIANTDGGDVCFYPDSNKLLVEQTGTLVRAQPELDYYDGEA
jgi:uncharacterized cupin superfamily protein